MLRGPLSNLLPDRLLVLGIALQVVKQCQYALIQAALGAKTCATEQPVESFSDLEGKILE